MWLADRRVCDLICDKLIKQMSNDGLELVVVSVD